MPFLEVSSGNHLYYKIMGVGFPLVFLHGWAMSSQVWRLQEELSSHYQLIFLDLRGHGLSAAPATGYSFHDFADDLVELFNALKLERAVAIGWSMGGQIVLQAIPLLHDRLAGAVLVSSTPRFVESDDYPNGLPHSAIKGLAAQVKRNRQKAVDTFVAGMFAAEEMQGSELGIEVPEPHALLAGLATLAASDLRPLLPSLTLPVLLVHGSEDAICLLSASEYMQEILPDACLEVIVGAGHAPFISRASDFNVILRKFVGSSYACD